MSSAVWAIRGVWLFDRNVPLFSKKFSRFGIIWRSDGTFGLSRKKWTLSNVRTTTCLTPFPRRHELDTADGPGRLAGADAPAPAATSAADSTPRAATVPRTGR